MKQVGKPDPYAYVPLQHQFLNKRYIHYATKMTKGDCLIEIKYHSSHVICRSNIFRNFTVITWTAKMQ